MSETRVAEWWCEMEFAAIHRAPKPMAQRVDCEANPWHIFCPLRL